MAVREMIIKLVIIAVIVFIVFVSAVVIVFFVSMKKSNKNPLAAAELSMLMFQIESGIIKLDALSDKEYIEIALKVCKLINEGGAVNEREHYFRNYFSRAPKTLDEMVKVILDTENNIFGWEMLKWQNTAFHMYGKDGEYNLKFVSADGHFEAVYNKDGVLLTQENDPLNMGTFNYAHQLSDQMTHYKLDVQPYFVWNNTRDATKIHETEYEAKAIDKNEEAMTRYNKYKELLTGK